MIPREGRRRVLALLGAGLALQGALLAGVLVAGGARVTAPRYLAYPFVWLDVAALALARLEWPRSRGWRRRATALGGGLYLLGLAALTGTVGLGGSTGLTVHWLPPGWGPMVVGGVGPLSFAVVPFRVVGIATLAVLLVAALRDRDRGPLAALLGVGTCASCTVLPAVTVVAGAVGGGLAGAGTWSLDLATVSFVLAVLVLSRLAPAA